jgi:RNA polymerase sigma-70 factor (ECF subfamily)
VEGRPPDDVSLAERARRGDERAFEELVRTYQGIAFRTAYLFTGSAADAEEAVQIGFVKAWSALSRFRQGAAFRPWLLRIVANEARNRRRSTRRRAELTLRASAAQPPEDAVPSPEGAALGRERREELLHAVERLDERDRDVLTCRYFLELSEEETAQALGVRRGTVKSRTARALERLRAELGGEVGGVGSTEPLQSGAPALPARKRGQR